MKPGESVVGIKNVTISEPFFTGHFPQEPIMPGMLILEGMAQASAFLLLHTADHPEKKLMYFSGVEKARFRKPVIPGDQLRYELKLLNYRMSTCKIKGKAYVGDKVAAEATFFITLVDKKV